MKIGVIQDESTFVELLQRCKEMKDQEKEIKATTKKLTDQVKTEFQSRDINEYNVPGVCCVKCTEVEKTSMNEEKLIDILTNIINTQKDTEVADSLKQCIEYKPCINEKKVQQLIYQGLLNTEDIAPAMETSVQTRLTFSKPKKED
jgi:hypothetical protein